MACMDLEMANEFRNLLDRDDLPEMIMEYDTTFNLGNYYVSWITFRFTEFMETEYSPMPTIGLACLIHLKKLQSSHEYFWNMVKEEIPEIASSKKLLICTDQEAAIVNAIERYVFPNIPRARCHIHAWKDQKMKLRSLGISSRSELAKYRSHFYELLHQKSYIEYCAVFRSFQRNSMNTEFATYFEKHIHPDMNSMGIWSLERYNVNYLLLTNRSESFNALLKRRFVKTRAYAEDEMILGSYEIVRRQLLRIKRARFGLGENWLLRRHLQHLYKLTDNTELGNIAICEEMDSIHIEEGKETEMVKYTICKMIS
ncbi:Uncharacterized protein APZ42_024881 [Daphnia magna]|uniref:MULE transposase domain-containing protein n=1 Tax=Daphnia magna TaxID=35525 RepID=A0A164TLS4_9CRUS|nr:Uncharacterized protein APZ42_024881 [Daphnia magna]